jgi:hypothetical protein
MTPEEFLRAPTNTYSDWFGEGDGHSDYRKTVGEGQPPIEVLRDGDMLCLVWADRVVVTGYDGNEYHQTFEFDRK